jgi:hypothetical protein
MTTLAIETTASNTNSSPWIDYGEDAAYVGSDNGVLYKIRPVFGGGKPSLVTADNWPVAVSTSANPILTDPIVDDGSNRIFIGDMQGYLYSIILHGPANAIHAQLAVGNTTLGPTSGAGIVDPPIVVKDPASPAHQVFTFTGCSAVAQIGAAITQLPVTFTDSTKITSANTVSLGSSNGTGGCTTGVVHAGTLDNTFWLNGSTSGHMIACGFVSGTTANPLVPSNPQMYFFPFANHVITSTGSSKYVVDTRVGDECSPLTEFYNGTKDGLFYGVGNAGSDGFLQSSTITTSLSTPSCVGTPNSSCVAAPAALGGVSGIVVDNQVSNGGADIYFSTLAPGSVNGQKCNVTGGAANPYCAVMLTQSALR